MSGAIYNVGIHLSAVNGVSTVLAAISKQMLGLHGSVHQLEQGFSRLNKAIVGTAMIGAGVGILKLGEHLEKAGEKLVHAENLLQSGLPKATSAIDMQIARTAAYDEAAKNLSTTLSGNIEHMHDLYNVVQDMGHAAHLLPVMNKLGSAFDFASDENKSKYGNGKNLASAARGFELTGRTSEESLSKVADEYRRTVIGLRGRIDGNMLMQTIQNSGAARYGYSDSFLTGGLGALQNVMGTRAGNGLYHLYNNLYGGVMSSQQQGLMQEKYGLHTEADRVYNDKGKFSGYKVGSVWGAETLAADPQKWANELVEKMRGNGVNVDDPATMRKAAGEMARGNKLLQAVFDEYLIPAARSQLNKERGQIDKVDLGEVDAGIEKDPKMWRQRLHKAIEDFQEAIGKQLVDPMIENVLKPLTQHLKDASQWALKNPELVKNIAEGIAMFGIALTGAGGATLLAALGPAGWLVGGLIGIVELMKKFDPQSFEAFKRFFMDLPMLFDASKWTDLWNRLKTEFKAGINTIIDGLNTDISGVFAKLRGWLADGIKSLLSLPGVAPGDAGDRGSAAGAVGDRLRGRPIPPPPGKQSSLPLNNHVHIALNEHEFARATTQSLASYHQHPTSAPHFDSSRGFMTGDGQFATG